MLQIENVHKHHPRPIARPSWKDDRAEEVTTTEHKRRTRKEMAQQVRATMRALAVVSINLQVQELVGVERFSHDTPNSFVPQHISIMLICEKAACLHAAHCRSIQFYNLNRPRGHEKVQNQRFASGQHRSKRRTATRTRTGRRC